MSQSESQPRQYETEIVDCDRCDGLGEVEDDVFVWSRCYSCWGRGTIEVCAWCLDEGTDERCDACGM
jgi:RecJ-like exonuclease